MINNGIGEFWDKRCVKRQPKVKLNWSCAGHLKDAEA